MDILSKLKPLYANLKRLQIGKYLYTKEFELFTIENNIDKIWKDCKKEVINKKRVIISGHHNTEDEEEAFGYLMTLWYEQEYNSFGEFITRILINFSIWHSTKLDFKSVHHNLKLIGLNENVLLDFTKEVRKIRDSKPNLIEESHIQTKKTPKLNLDNKKVFIVHGHDDAARMELAKIIKNDLCLEPIILQEEPNVSIETIISKFERLAKDCSSALILFTPDDEANGKLRARQNVILELGYFLGKFHDSENRKIAIIKQGDIEIPSDISGVLYLEYHKNIKEIFYDLKKQFETWGIN
ncbi:TIR domain-containing protein [Christiangramia echinicola]|uniref:TIR domain-containing protein n=1 Tax=Christiangramia echinicola TaxID=279359 RepID=UPI000417BB5A|nr:nucleotide-binding protein [Christiangramia echinicola]